MVILHHDFTVWLVRISGLSFCIMPCCIAHPLTHTHTHTHTFHSRCEQCGSVSMISHRYHTELCMRVDGIRDDDLPRLHEYYTRMCIGAEQVLHLRRMNCLEKQQHQQQS